MIHPDSLNAGAYAEGRNQITNLKAVLNDILGHGNENCLLPGQLEAMWAEKLKPQVVYFSPRLRFKHSTKSPLLVGHKH